MSLWLLLEGAQKQGVTVPLKIGRFTYGPPQYNFDIKIEPDNNDDLYRSAQAGGGEAYRLLWREGYVRQSATGRFKLEQIPPHIHGSSGDLLFALALIVTALPRRKAYPPLAATGVVSDKGYVQSVQGIPAKIAAALKIMPEGGLIFYPRANEAEINADIIATAKGCKVELFPVDRLDQAAVKLGVSIRKIYLDAPYRGLQTFQYEHRSIYFGRQREIEVVRERLLDREALNNSGLLIVAASGAGKSSFVQAGLIPALEQGPHALADRPIIWSEWRPSDVFQTDNERDISESIRNSWLQQASAKAQLIGLKQCTSLTELVEQMATVLPEQYRLMWLIDQFEELFTSGYSEVTIKTFADFLMRLQQLGVWIVATVRGDFYGQYLQSPFFNCFGDLGVYHLRNLNPTALNQIITGPAGLADVSFEIDKNGDSLSSLLLNDIGDRVDALPLLEFTLRKLYIARDTQQQMKLATYQHGGGLLGGIGQYAESIFAPLRETSESQLYRLLWAMTRSPNEQTDQQFTARPVLLDDFSPEDPLRTMIDVFTENRLLTLDRSKQDQKIRIRVAHDALLNHWPRAKTIIEGFRQDKHLHDRLLEQAHRWLLAKQESSLLLSAGLPLAEAEDLLQERRTLLDASVVDYIDASREAESEYRRRELERIEQEKMQEQRAREQAELVAEQQTELAEQRQADVLQQRKMKRMALVAVVILLVITVFAGWQWWEAGRQRSVAEHQTSVAEQGKEKLVITLARSNFIQGVQLMQQDKPRQALAYFARSIETSGDKNSTDLATSIITVIPVAIRKFNHKGRINSAKFSPDGLRIVTASFDNSVRVWDVDTGLPISAPMEHQGWVMFVAFSPDGHQVVTASMDNTARVWDADTGLPISAPMEHQYGLRSSVFSPDGLQIVTASLDKTARVWNAQTGLPISAPMEHQKAVVYAAFSPNGRRIVTASLDSKARLWDAETGLLVSAPMEHEKPVVDAAFSPDGQRIITASNDKTARVWNAETGLPISVPMVHDDTVWSAKFSPDGQQIITASNDKTARVWNAETGLPISVSMVHKKNVLSAIFSPDGRLVVTASGDNTARLWNAETGVPISLPMVHQKSVISAAFSPDGSHIVTASSDNTAQMWNVGTVLLVSTTMLHKDIVYSAKFSSDGQRIVTASRDNTAQVWNAETGLPISVPMVHDDTVWSAKFSPDGQQIITASRDNTARVWNAETGLPTSVPMVHDDPVWSAKFSPDGSLVVTASKDNTARIWNAETGLPVSEPLEHQEEVRSAAFSPDGLWIVTASLDHTARVWNTKTGLPISKTHIEHQEAVVSAAFSPDGRRIITTSWDNTARAWNAETLLPISAPMVHQDGVLSAAFSPDGHRIVTTSSDNTARVWNIETGLPVSAPMAHKDNLKTAFFSPDARKVITASWDNTTQMWDAETGLAISVPMVHQDNVWSAEFSPDGYRVVTSSTDGAVRVWEIIQLTHPGTSFTNILEQIAGFQLNSAGALEALPNKSISELHTLLTKTNDLNSAPRHFIEWLLSDPLDRTVTPNSKQTVKQRVQQLIDINTVQSLNEALDYWPGHPMALAKLAAATLHGSTPKKRKKEIPTIRLWANLALRYAPGDQVVSDIAETVLKEIEREQTATQ